MEGTPVALMKAEAGNHFMIYISNHYVVHPEVDYISIKKIN